jgi:GT2 family glycosyltransferase
MMDITIIIVNWNSGFHLKNCINSIKISEQGSSLPIVVVDNFSQDNSVNLIQSVDGVKIITLKENLGFSKACNIGASAASSSLLLFLNPDTIIFKDTILKAVQFMNSPTNSNIGICGVNLSDQEGCVARTCVYFPTPLKFIFQSLGIDRFFKKYSHFMTGWSHDTNRIVDQVIGAFFLVRRNLFVQLNGFDPRFFMYFEELDFSLRAFNAGWLSIYLANIKAVHFGGGCSKQVKAKRLFYMLRSKILFAIKNFTLPSASIVIIVTMFIEPFIRIFYAILTGSLRKIGQTLYAYTFLFLWAVYGLFSIS